MALRFVAVLLDLLVLLLLAIPIAVLTGGVHTHSDERGTQAVLVVHRWPALVLWLGYYVLCEALFDRTLGKRAVGLRVISEDGTPVGLGQTIVRNVFRIPVAFYLVAAIAVWRSPKKQRIGDRVAGTLVIQS